MSYIFTKHALRKYKKLRLVGISLTKAKIVKTIKQPEHVESQSDNIRFIASGKLYKGFLLRVVYRFEIDGIIIITFYPAREGRYY